MDTLIDFGTVIVGLSGLFFGGNWLVKGAARLASSYGVSPVVIGLTVVALGTSTPELLVSLNAALEGTSDISIGNVLGSNIANVGLILGSTGLITPIIVHWQLIRREIPMMIGFSVFTFVLALDQTISRIDGLLLSGGFIAFTVLSYFLSRRERREITPEIEEFDDAEHLIDLDSRHRWRELGLIAAGIGLLMFGARLTVDGATAIARDVGVDELVIGLTLVAFGTSLPELATSVIAALRHENDIAVGNVVGSNITNLLLILGLTALARPIPIRAELLQLEFPVMLGFAIVLLPFTFKQVLRRAAAAALLAGYVGFSAFIFIF
jgi:cation:H+ antiporter